MAAPAFDPGDQIPRRRLHVNYRPVSSKGSKPFSPSVVSSRIGRRRDLEPTAVSRGDQKVAFGPRCVSGRQGLVPRVDPTASLACVFALQAGGRS
eukprot:1198483-Heterocapsa_arctica.AAC.1